MTANTSGQYSAMNTGQWEAVLAEPESRSRSVFAHAIEALKALDERMGDLVKAKAETEKQ